MTDIWLDGVTVIESSHCDERPCGAEDIDLLVIHNISLPPAQTENDFTSGLVEDFFTGKLDTSIHPFFDEIAELRVSSHLYITRPGKVVQFVPLNKRAWHAGKSDFNGRTRCNDFSIGIEMQGTDFLAYTEAQYDSLVAITKQLQSMFPKIVVDHIVGHQDISPGRKSDPGESFDWSKYKRQL